MRPYSDFGLGGKLIKTTVPIQQSKMFQAMYVSSARLSRWAAWKAHGQPTAFHYRPIAANYKEYWMPDSDAVNSLDVFETYLWFRSRGGQCVNCPPAAQLVSSAEMPLIVRVKTGERSPSSSAGKTVTALSR